MRDHGFDRDLTDALIEEFICAIQVHRTAQRIDDTSLLPLRLEQLAQCLPAQMRWVAWQDGGHTDFAIVNLQLRNAAGDIDVRAHAWFFDHERIASSGSWRRTGPGEWRLSSTSVDLRSGQRSVRRPEAPELREVRRAARLPANVRVRRTAGAGIIAG